MNADRFHEKPEIPFPEPTEYEGLALIADPIHRYISFTVPEPGDPDEITEKDLIDSQWVQRLRAIYQLQSARWVYPAAEHSRFQHSIGAMHVAGRFAQHLYSSLKSVVPEVPSQPYIEELLRVAALLHDVGHGPFCHFFDEHVLDPYDLTHERIGQVVIQDHLGALIRGLRRSPGGPFAPREVIDPSHIAFLILKEKNKASAHHPKWLTLLQAVLGGIYTADNLDYVLRDAYMCGVAIGPVDVDRLIHYSFITEHGLTIHKAGLPALQMFLNARLYLYSNVYYHRTTRAIDIHMRDIFPETIRMLFPYNPVDQLDRYWALTDTSLLEEVRRWPSSVDPGRLRLGSEWRQILLRKPKWKMAFAVTLPTGDQDAERPGIDAEAFESLVRRHLPASLKELEFRVDLASQDARPENPLSMGGFQIYVYDPSKKTVSKEALKRCLDFLPARIVQLRIFARDHQADADLAQAAEAALTRV